MIRRKIARLVIQTDKKLNVHLIKCFRCISIDHIITKFPKPPKYNNKALNNVCFNERVYCASQKTLTIMTIPINIYMHL